MARTRFGTILFAALVARPAFAHPGHGAPGWLHHGEPLVLAVIVAAGLVAWWRGTAGAARWRNGR